jgi:hypothetical protein
VDRHHTDADPDPDPTFHFNAHPDLLVLHMLENLELFLTGIHNTARLHKLFYLSCQRQRCRIFFDTFWKMYDLALQLVEIGPVPDTDPAPNRQTLDDHPDPAK